MEVMVASSNYSIGNKMQTLPAYFSALLAFKLVFAHCQYWVVEGLFF